VWALWRQARRRVGGVVVTSGSPTPTTATSGLEDPREGGSTREFASAALRAGGPLFANHLRGVVALELAGESVESIRRQTDLRGWTGVGLDGDVDAAIAAVLRAIEEVLSEWNDEDNSASDALDLVADAADVIEGVRAVSVSGGGEQP
jgi:hypothetical protein